MEKRDKQGVSSVSEGRDPWLVNEEARLRQLREDAQRPLAENLAEALALSEFVSTFAGSARSA